MAIKKYLSLDKLTEYDALLKAKIAADDDATLEKAKTDASNKDAVILAETQKSINAIQVAVDNISNLNHDDDYDAKGAADTALASARTYADNAANAVKNDLLNGAGSAYDTLKELGDLIVDNADAIDALEEIASGKANATHSHAISDITGLQTALDDKVTAEALTNAINDVKENASNKDAVVLSEAQKNIDTVQTNLDTHIDDTTKHITSTERTNWGAAYTHSQSAHAPNNAQANVIESIKINGTTQTISSKSVNITVPTQASDIGAATATHTHAISDITNLQTTLNNASSAISANTNSINVHTDRISALETKVGDGIEEITSEEIQALFADGYTVTINDNDYYDIYGDGQGGYYSLDNGVTWNYITGDGSITLEGVKQIKFKVTGDNGHYVDDESNNTICSTDDDYGGTQYYGESENITISANTTFTLYGIGD